MKVAIDVSPLQGGHQYRGIGAYTKHLTAALASLKDDNEYLLTTSPTSENVDVIHYPFFDLFFLTLPMKRYAPTVVTVHDVIPLVYPDYYPPGMRGKLKFKIQRRSLEKVDAILTDSDTSKKDIIKLLNISEKKVHRVYLAADDSIKPLTRPDYVPILKKYNINKPYLLYVGDINYNKNISGFIEAYAQVKDQLDLLMISRAMGGSSIEAKDINKLIAFYGLENNVHVLINVPHDPLIDLAALYSAATAYIQPSFYEGFGLPVLEAMKCKTPVISSGGGSLKEIVGNGAITFDPKDRKSLIDAINNVLSLSIKERSELIKQGLSNVRRYSWEKTAKKTVEVYESILENN